MLYFISRMERRLFLNKPHPLESPHQVIFQEYEYIIAYYAFDNNITMHTVYDMNRYKRSSGFMADASY